MVIGMLLALPAKPVRLTLPGIQLKKNANAKERTSLIVQINALPALNLQLGTSQTKNV